MTSLKLTHRPPFATAFQKTSLQGTRSGRHWASNRTSLERERLWSWLRRAVPSVVKVRRLFPVLSRCFSIFPVLSTPPPPRLADPWSELAILASLRVPYTSSTRQVHDLVHEKYTMFMRSYTKYTRFFYFFKTRLHP